MQSGYNSCERCIQKGEWVDRKVILPEINAPLRTDLSFDKMFNPSHHHAASPLKELNFGLVSRFNLDYMHLVCLGVMRRLLNMWKKGPLKSRLSAKLITQLSERLCNFKFILPKEFSRKPRSLQELNRWKATEFRQFLLYTGPVMFKGFLNNTMYQHFLLFSTAMSCCFSTNHCYHYAEYFRKLLTQFWNLLLYCMEKAF